MIRSTKTQILFVVAIAMFAVVLGLPAAIANRNADRQSDPLTHATRSERNGWIYIHLEGSPSDVGYQHGYLLAREIDESLRVFKKYLPHTTARDWQFYRDSARELFWRKIGDEYQKEIEGIARGASARGVKIDTDDVLAMNAWIELASYYIPSLHQARLANTELHQTPPPSCSAFIATGSWTRTGEIVIGHNNWIDYLIGRRWNIMIDLQPASGHRILMDSFPGFIHSGDDFYITDAGLMITETTIAQFKGFETEGLPEFYRIRKATQYANSIDDWLKVMMDHPNGGYANDWLIGDRKTGEIARLENGIKNNIIERTRDGYFVGSNFPVHEKTIKEETTFDPAAVNSATSRHRRWDELMKQNKGRIDINLAKRFEADHYDVVRKREGGSANTLCGHVDLDQRGCPEWDWATFYPGGTVNAKVADSQLAKRMTMWASAGHPCGTGFRLEPFLKDHPEYSWSRDIAGDMPSGAWTMFSINSRKVTEEVGVRRTVHQDGPYYDNRRNNSNDGVPTYPNPRKP
jgi:hypothetical protein